MTQTPTQIARQLAAAHGFDLDTPLRIGGNYLPVTEHQHVAWVSGQVPRVGDTVVVTGHVGATTSLESARDAARICCLRTLAVLQQAFGLERIEAILKLNVFVQSAPGFTQQSEVADAASDLLVQVFGPRGAQARTSVGVSQLPKNAAVELDLTVALRAA